MGRIDWLVLRVIFAVGFVAVAALALIYANEWWLSGVLTVSILCWLGGVLAAIYSRAERRPALVGAVVVALLYVTLALGPWFRVQVGPWLVTSQALAYVEMKWPGREQPQTQQQQIVTSYPVFMDSGVVLNSSYIVSTPTGTNTVVWTTPQTPSASIASRFVAIGHWLCGWIAAAIGGLAAAWISRVRPDKALTIGQGAQPITPTNVRGFDQAEESS